MRHGHVLFTHSHTLLSLLFLAQLDLSGSLPTLHSSNLPRSEIEHDEVTRGMRFSLRSTSQPPLFGNCGGTLQWNEMGSCNLLSWSLRVPERFLCPMSPRKCA
ncbi:hypothetical protein C8R44DRAFT_196904 [Mycena epipterygia]|nr:hypothetical protein C8R44DRAFT_196904 [Mycena epipterygia]